MTDDFAAKVKGAFDPRWGAFRKFIAAHPLKAFWSALALGFVIGAVLL